MDRRVLPEQISRQMRRLQGWDYRSPGWYFVTICSRDHIRIFVNIDRGKLQLPQPDEVATQNYVICLTTTSISQ